MCEQFAWKWNDNSLRHVVLMYHCKLIIVPESVLVYHLASTRYLNHECCL